MKQITYAFMTAILIGGVLCMNGMELSKPKITIIKIGATDIDIVICQPGYYFFEAGAEATFDKNVSGEYTDLLFVENVRDPMDHFISMHPVKRKFEVSGIYRVQLHGL